jgi:lysophospholipase L1-like esterase
VRRLLPTTIALVAVGILATACSSGSDGTAGDSGSTKQGPRYVALGDSYTAGPQLAPGDGRSGACDRSLKNYPHLVAKAIDAESFTDVSCSGATTDNVLEAAPIGGVGKTVPAQLNSVKDDTTLVTVGIGGNDDGMFSALASSCTKEGTACADYLSGSLPTVLRSTRKHVAATLAAVAERAPKATIVLVGYLGVVPPTAGCEALGGAGLDTKGVFAGERRIDAMMASAAKDAGVPYVSMNSRSEGHDACAGSAAWTNGIAPDALGVGASLHPREDGMKAVADAVEQELKSAA